MDSRTKPTSHEQYVTGVAYQDLFLPHLSPLDLGYVAKINGVEPPATDREFRYCDIGCGTGLSVSLLAAAFPHGEFVGIDLQAEHIAQGQQLANAGQLENLELFQADISCLDPAEFPVFDFIVVHGVFTWVGPEIQDAILRFVDARLAPGGLFYIGYNTLPGWSALRPIRDAMQMYVARMSATTEEKATKALAYLQFMRDAGAAFASESQRIRDWIDATLKKDLAYLVHEYFTPHWEPLYFEQMVGRLEPLALDFVGGLPFAVNNYALTVPSDVVPSLASAPSRTIAEQHCDFATNRLFRRDVFIRDGGSTESNDLLADVCFGTCFAPGEIRRKVSFDHARIRYDGEVYDPLWEALLHRADTPAGLASHHSPLAPFDLEDVTKALQLATYGEQVRPFASRTEPRSPADGDTRYRTVLPFNRAMLERGLWHQPELVLAVPAAGNGLFLPFVDALLTRGLEDAGARQLSEWAALACEEHGGNHVTDDVGAPLRGQPLRDAMNAATERFLRDRLPKLLELEVLAPI